MCDTGPAFAVIAQSTETPTTWTFLFLSIEISFAAMCAGDLRPYLALTLSLPYLVDRPAAVYRGAYTQSDDYGLATNIAYHVSRCETTGFHDQD
jgi:hypothetical protein